MSNHHQQTNMNRRKFIKVSSISLAGTSLIGPSLEGITPWEVPSTLNLSARAKAALNYFIQNPDRDAKFRPFFVSNLEADPHYLQHSEWDFGDISSRFVETIIYIRKMTGDDSGKEVEMGLRKFMCSFLDPADGLLYRPQLTSDSNQSAPSGGRAYIWDQGRTLHALVAWYQTEGELQVLRRIEKLVDGLDRIAVHKDDSCYFPTEAYLGNGKWLDHRLLWVPDGQPIDPLMRYFELTGDRKALELAGKLAKSVMTREPLTFSPDGEMLRDAYRTHFHARTSTLVGLLRLGIASKDENLIGFVEKAYRWARSKGSSFGWMPENIVVLKWSETCSVNDMINLAVLLAKTGRDEYWEDVERFTRNYIAECQILSEEMLPKLRKKFPEEVPGSRSFDRVSERVIGGFIGSVLPNERFRENTLADGFCVSGCCSPSGTNALYQAWSHIVTDNPDEIWINMMLNTDTPGVKINSGFPYEGQITILIKKAIRTAYVRVPSWVKRKDVIVRRNGKKQEVVWKGNYIVQEDMKEHDEIRMLYPVKIFDVRETIAGDEYLLHWQGFTLMGIEPPGKSMPMYQRKEYK